MVIAIRMSKPPLYCNLFVAFADVMIGLFIEQNFPF